MRRPEILQPILRREAWTVATVAEAFADEFRDQLQSVAPGDHLSLVAAGND